MKINKLLFNYFLIISLAITSPSFASEEYVESDMEVIEEKEEISTIENIDYESRTDNTLDEALYTNEKEQKLELAIYLAKLEQGNFFELLTDEDKQKINEEINLAFSLLNKPFEVSNQFLATDIIQSLDNNIKGLKPDFIVPDLTSENTDLINARVADYMDKGLPLNYKLLSTNLSLTGNMDKVILQNLIDSVLKSRKYYESDTAFRKLYREAVARPQKLVDMGATDTKNSYPTYEERLEYHYKKLIDDILMIERFKNNESETLIGINQDSAFFTNDLYKISYLQLTEDQRTILDSMEIDDKTKHLSIDEVDSSARYGTPIFIDDWLYPFMKDGDFDGIVGEGQRVEKVKYDENLYKLYKETSLENRLIVNRLDTNKNAYVEDKEIEDANFEITEETRWIEGFKPPHSDNVPDPIKESPAKVTTTTVTLTDSVENTITENNPPLEIPTTQTLPVTTQINEVIEPVYTEPTTVILPTTTQSNVSTREDVNTGIDGIELSLMTLSLSVMALIGIRKFR